MATRGTVPRQRPALAADGQQKPRQAGLCLREGRRGGQKIAHGSEKGLAKLVTALQAEAGLEPCGPHRRRHNGLTHAAGRGASPHALQALARHGDPGTTARYYLHLKKAELAREALAALTGTAPRGGTDEAVFQDGQPENDWHG